MEGRDSAVYAFCVAAFHLGDEAFDAFFEEFVVCGFNFQGFRFLLWVQVLGVIV